MGKKTNKEQEDSVKSSLHYKIFDVLKVNNKSYYLDKEFNLIWDDNKEVVGIIDKKIYHFFDDIDKLIETIKNENITF